MSRGVGVDVRPVCQWVRPADLSFSPGHVVPPTTERGASWGAAVSRGGRGRCRGAGCRWRPPCPTCPRCRARGRPRLAPRLPPPSAVQRRPRPAEGPDARRVRLPAVLRKSTGLPGAGRGRGAGASRGPPPPVWCLPLHTPLPYPRTTVCGQRCVAYRPHPPARGAAESPPVNVQPLGREQGGDEHHYRRERCRTSPRSDVSEKEPHDAGDMQTRSEVWRTRLGRCRGQAAQQRPRGASAMGACRPARAR